MEVSGAVHGVAPLGVDDTDGRQVGLDGWSGDGRGESGMVDYEGFLLDGCVRDKVKGRDVED